MSIIKWKKGAKRTSGILWRYFTATCYTREWHSKAIGLNYGFTDIKIIDHQTFFREDEYDKMLQLLKQKIKHDLNYFKIYESLCYKYCRNHINNSKRISKIGNTPKKSNKELKQLFNSYIYHRCLVGIFLNTLWMVRDILNTCIKEELKKQKIGKNPDKLLSILIVPFKETSFIQKEIDLLTIGRYIQKNGLVNLLNKGLIKDNIAKNKILQHIEKFGWINTNQFFGEPLTYNGIIKELKDLVKEDCKQKLKEIHYKRKQAKLTANNLVKKLHLNKKLIKLIEIARNYMYLETYRVDALNYSDYLITNLLNEIARRMEFSIEELKCISHKEILDFLETSKKPKIAEIRDRMESYAILNIHGNVKIISGKELKDYLKLKQNYQKQFKEFKGNMANKGTAKGRVKIINDISDMGKMRKGNILVSSMTHHSLTPALRKAAAIVTDEGGLTCHAAIISREFGLPCIVGTKMATKVLKDDDLVEIDADRGIVRKLK